MIIHDSKANAITHFPVNEHGDTSMPVVVESGSIRTVHLDAQNLALTSNFMLISLDSTGIWKHTETSLIHVDWLAVNINPSSSFRGDVYIGYLENTTATTGDLHIVKTYHVEQAGNQIQAFLSFSGAHLICSSDYHYGPIIANDSSFGNNARLLGPSGYTHFGCYDGDLVMRVARTAGNTDVGITLGYHTT